MLLTNLLPLGFSDTSPTQARPTCLGMVLSAVVHSLPYQSTIKKMLTANLMEAFTPWDLSSLICLALCQLTAGVMKRELPHLSSCPLVILTAIGCRFHESTPMLKWAFQSSGRRRSVMLLYVIPVSSLVPQDGLWWDCVLGGLVLVPGSYLEWIDSCSDLRRKANTTVPSHQIPDYILLPS